MKKFIFGIIAAAIVFGMLIYCSSSDGYQINDWSWKKEKPKIITWKKLETYVFEDQGFKVEYPSTFTVDTTGDEVVFWYEVDDEVILMQCYSIRNPEKWDVQTAADSIVEIRRAIINDSVVMKDMHPDYFYLKGYDDEKGLGFYEQYVVDKDVIYTYELCYPMRMEKRVRRLMDLVHNWDPEPRR